MYKEAVVYIQLSVMRKTEIFPLPTTRMDLGGIMLEDSNKIRENSLWSHLHVESKKVKLIESRMMAVGQVVVAKWEMLVKGAKL